MIVEERMKRLLAWESVVGAMGEKRLKHLIHI